MAKVKIEGVVDHLRNDFTRALRATLEEHFPDMEFNEYDIYKTFKKKVHKYCKIRENIPDRYVEND